MIRALGLALLLALTVFAAPATAGVLSLGDATDLAQSLAEAEDDQDICYGWRVTNNFDGLPDVGSSSGPGRLLVKFGRSSASTGVSCSKGYVELQGDIHYSCGSCESEDSASVSIDSNLDDPPTVGDLERLGLKAGDLTGDKDDTTLVNMVEALPLLAADRGNAAYVAYEPAKTVPTADHATGKPGSDFLRESWIWLVLCGAAILGGPTFYLYRRAQADAVREREPRRRRKPRPPTETPPSPAEPPPPSPAT